MSALNTSYSYRWLPYLKELCSHKQLDVFKSELRSPTYSILETGSLFARHGNPAITPEGSLLFPLSRIIISW